MVTEKQQEDSYGYRNKGGFLMTNLPTTQNQWQGVITAQKLKDTGVADIRNGLKKIMLYLGIGSNNQMTSKELDFLAIKMQQLFGQHSIRDYEVAIDLVNTRKIVYDINLYGKPLTIPFLAGLLEKYIIYRNKQKQYLNLLPQLNGRSEPTKEEVMASMKKGVLELFNTAFYYDNMGFYFYNYLVDDIMVLKPSKEEKTVAFEWAKEYVLNQKKAKSKTVKDAINAALKPDDNTLLINRAKEKILFDYLNEIKEMGLKLETILDEKNT